MEVDPFGPTLEDVFLTDKQKVMKKIAEIHVEYGDVSNIPIMHEYWSLLVQLRRMK